MNEIKITKLPNSEVQIEGEISAEAFEKFFEKSLKEIQANFEADGFRKGKAPESVVLSKVPEIQIMQDAAELALNEEYPKIVEKEKLDVITPPEIAITKMARNNPLGFKIKTTLLPELTLPDYKKVAKAALEKANKEQEKIEVTEEELEKTIEDIRKSRAPKKHIKEQAKEDAKSEDGAEKPADQPAAEAELELPELNNEFVQSLGEFKDVEDFKQKLRENMMLEKQNMAREKTRLKIMEAIMKETKVELPKVLVDIEIDKILYKMKSDITAMGLKFEDYLKNLNKKEEDLRTDFQKDGEDRAKLAMVLHEIAKVEEIKPDQEQVEQEVAMILNHYKDADPERARAHTENVLVNEKIFQLLESL